MKQKFISNLSVTKICQLLYDPAKVLKPSYYSGGFGRGIRWHEHLGFTNRTSVSKLLYGYKITGRPDYIDNEAVGDAKTYENVDSYYYMLGLAKLQTNLYGFLADRKKRIVIMIDVNTSHTKELSFRTNMTKAQRDIHRAIDKWNRLRGVLNLI